MIFITICARGGSKGIPGKNIKPINGIPLIAYSINHAKQFAAKVDADIALSTDSEEIQSVAAEHGLECEYKRPEELAGDSTGKEAAMRHVMEYFEGKKGSHYDYVLDLDVTSPLRTVDDLLAGYQAIEAVPDAYNLYSVNPAQRNPYFNMVEEGSDGFYPLCKIPEVPILSRQNAPKVYDLNASFYFYRRSFFHAGFKNPFTPKSLIYEMPHICFDLDEPLDYEFLEYLISHNKLTFQV